MRGEHILFATFDVRQVEISVVNLLVLGSWPTRRLIDQKRTNLWY